ncbi:hypothetical protein [Streptomyces sp. DH37]|uniref:hypothetical protein n=1 Tax=Streptomyces sp. DH37 TaxID=3040122 RepID=UPI0024424E87|nr:hypothetical protein [Streptomyces sp. DH37]MDG9701238.1 hypothetical protein [Streptomyces sp. DH37]
MTEPRQRQGDTPDDRRALIREERRDRRDLQEPGERRGGTRAPGGPAVPTDLESDAERRRRRAVFLRELNEAKALRERVQPRRARAARMRQAMRMRTFRW